MQDIGYIIAALILAYLLGSVPTAVWISKFIYKDDIRNHGSGNAGSTNMFRVFGVKAGIATQVVDILKGVGAVGLIRLLWGLLMVQLSPTALDAVLWVNLLLLAGFVAAIGHIWPLFAGFRGGKGINTLFGAILMIDPAAAGVCIAVFALVLLSTRYVSLGSMLGTATFPFYWAIRYGITVGDSPWPFLIAAAMPVLVFYTHRSNIQRLLAGNENRANLFGKKGPE